MHFPDGTGHPVAYPAALASAGYLNLLTNGKIPFGALQRVRASSAPELNFLQRIRGIVGTLQNPTDRTATSMNRYVSCRPIPNSAAVFDKPEGWEEHEVKDCRYVRLQLALLCLLCATVPAFGENGPEPNLQRSDEFRTCVENSKGVTVNMLDCLADEHRRAERELDRAYSILFKQLKSRALRDRLAETQRIWIRHRDDDCKRRVEDAGLAGASGGALIYSDCMLTSATRRITWLGMVSADPGVLGPPRSELVDQQ